MSVSDIDGVGRSPLRSSSSISEMARSVGESWIDLFVRRSCALVSEIELLERNGSFVCCGSVSL